jgi:4-hydroxy-tetrahydrodipicolinate reductase
MTMGIVVMGGSGRMGRMLIDVIDASEEARLVGVTEASGHPWTGRDLGEAMGGAARGVPVTDDPIEVVARARAVIDFTTPAATRAMSELAAQARAVHVVGTTGLSVEDVALLDRAAHHATVIRAGNMSLGVNLMTQLVRRVAYSLGPEYDIEIVEAHHRHKVDAPSGTALMLGEAAAEGRGALLGAVADRGRDGITGERRLGAIGFHAVRGGDVVGEHDVIFAGPGERIVLRHLATDRSVFARGALRAALWGADKGPGAFDMLDVLDLR